MPAPKGNKNAAGHRWKKQGPVDRTKFGRRPDIVVRLKEACALLETYHARFSVEERQQIAAAARQIAAAAEADGA